MVMVRALAAVGRVVAIAVVMFGCSLDDAAAATTFFSLTCPNPADPKCTTTPLMPLAVVTPSPGVFTNCIASEGCFGTAGLVDAPPGGNMPTTFTLHFALSPAEVAAIAANAGFGRLTVVASRDLGRRGTSPLCTPPPSPAPNNCLTDPPLAPLSFNTPAEWLTTLVDGQHVADLFRNRAEYSIENPSNLAYTNAPECPAGERGTNYPNNVNCGLNFHTDVRGTQVVEIPQVQFQAAASDGTIQIDLQPTLCSGTSCVGRVKIFSVQLEYLQLPTNQPIPTLSEWARWLLIIALSLVAVIALRRTR